MAIKKKADKEFQDLKKRVQELTDELGRREEKMFGGVESMAEKGQHYWNDAYDSLNENFSTAKDKAKKAGKEADRFASDNPWAAAGIAAAVGFLVGMMSDRRR